MSTTVQLIDTDRLVVVDGFNPRTSITEEALKELTFSVKSHGILTPISVTALEDGTFQVLDGHQRTKVARALGITQLPAHVHNGDTDAATVALVTNVVRSDLHPVDEGKALARVRDERKLKSATAIAKATGLPVARVTRNLRYADLPVEVQTWFITGTLPLNATDAVCAVSKLGQPFLLALLDRQQRNDSEDIPEWESSDLDDLIHDPAHYIGRFLASVERSDDWTVLQAGDAYNAIAFCPELDELRATVHGLYNWPWQVSNLIDLDSDEINAARAYGCLVELGEINDADARFVTDRNWYVDRLRPKLERAIELGEAKRKNLAAMDAAEAGPAGEHVTVPAKSPEQELEERRAANKAAREQREALDRSNREFGANLQAKLGKRKPTADDMKLIVELLMYPAGTDNLWKMGWVRINDELTSAETLPSGRTKLAELPSNEARAKLFAWVTRPSNPEEITGRLLQVLAAAAFADHEAVAMSRRFPNLTVGLEHLFKLAQSSLPEGLKASVRTRVDYAKKIRSDRNAWDKKLQAADKRLKQQADAAAEEQEAATADIAEEGPSTP